MKKIIVLSLAAMLTGSLVFAQDKPKSMKQLRDSVFTEMKLSEEHRKAMHDLIAESGKGNKIIKEDASLSEEQKKEKLAAFSKSIREKERGILTPEQQKIWKDFAAEVKRRNETKK